ncbi:MAG TPA: LLM class flavin-dependent oxidoreductase, partial [Actinomycetota bacterium]
LDHGADPNLDVIAEGETPADDASAAAAMVAPWAEAGSTWWLETRWEEPHHSAERMGEVRARIAAGPPSSA